jgi:hypothetical protein
MADGSNNKIEKKEAPASSPSSSPKQDIGTPKEVSSSRVEIAGALIEGQDAGEVIESGEVREMMSEAREAKGDGMAVAKKKDDGQAAQTGGAATTTAFTFDEKNLPPAPEMIRKIEESLRAEIQELERDLKKYQGGFLRKPNPEKLSAAMIEMRKKNVLLRRIVTMASEALKKLFLQMFGTKK